MNVMIVPYVMMPMHTRINNKGNTRRGNEFKAVYLRWSFSNLSNGDHYEAVYRCLISDSVRIDRYGSKQDYYGDYQRET